MKPRFAERDLRDFILLDPSIFITWLPVGSAKTQPDGHRRGRPPRTSCERSGQKVLLSFYVGRRRARPSCSNAKAFLLLWSRRPKRN